MPPDHHPPVGVAPVAGLAAADRLLHVRAEAWSRLAGQHREPPLDAVLALDRVGERDLAHVDLGPDEVLVRRQPCGVRRRDGEPRQRQPDPEPALLPQRPRRGADVADGIHVGDQFRIRWQVGQVGPVGQVHAVLAGEPAVDLLVATGSNGAATRASICSAVYSVSNAARPPLQNRRLDRRMYQLLSMSRYAGTVCARAGDVVAVHLPGHCARPALASWPAHSGRGCSGWSAQWASSRVRVCVHGEEGLRVPQRDQHRRTPRGCPARRRRGHHRADRRAIRYHRIASEPTVSNTSGTSG